MLVGAVRRGFDQAFTIAALMASLGIVAGLLAPRLLGKPSEGPRP